MFVNSSLAVNQMPLFKVICHGCSASSGRFLQSIFRTYIFVLSSQYDIYVDVTIALSNKLFKGNNIKQM